MPDIVLAPSVKAPSMWRGNDPRAALADLEFERVKPVVLARARRTCAGCELSPVLLEVHHRNNNHADNRPDNLVGLCRYCHAVFHAGFHQAGMARSIASRWYGADDPLPAGLQAAVSRWAAGAGAAPPLPAGAWLSAEQAASFIGHLTALAENVHAAPGEVAELQRRALWVPLYRERRGAH